MSGLLVQKGLKHTIVDPADLQTYTQLSAGTVKQKQLIPIQVPLSQLRDQIAAIFSDVTDPDPDTSEGREGFVVAPGVEVLEESERMVQMRWTSDPMADTVADALVALITQLQLSGLRGVQYRSAVPLLGPTGGGARRNGSGQRALENGKAGTGGVGGGGAGGGGAGGRALALPGGALVGPEAAGLIDEVLESIFGAVESDDAKGAWVVRVDDVTATIDMTTHDVACKDAKIEEQVKAAVRRIVQAIFPIDCGC